MLTQNEYSTLFPGMGFLRCCFHPEWICIVVEMDLDDPCSQQSLELSAKQRVSSDL